MSSNLPPYPSNRTLDAMCYHSYVLICYSIILETELWLSLVAELWKAHVFSHPLPPKHYSLDFVKRSWIMFLKAKLKDAPFCSHNLAPTLFFHIQKDNNQECPIIDERHELLGCGSIVSSEKNKNKSKEKRNCKTLKPDRKRNINSIREKRQIPF